MTCFNDTGLRPLNVLKRFRGSAGSPSELTMRFASSWAAAAASSRDAKLPSGPFIEPPVCCTEFKKHIPAAPGPIRVLMWIPQLDPTFSQVLHGSVLQWVQSG